MSLKPRYKDTRGDLRKLLKDAKPGDRVYVINEHAVSGRGEDKKTYSEWVVTNSRTLGTNAYYVESPSHGGQMGLDQLLCQRRAVYGSKPAGMPNLAAKHPHDAYSDAAQRAALIAAERHAEEAAQALSRQYAGSR
ncbi:hypothetical protein [Streptomyces cinereoruber]|uniref:hypothetical protein n=1 Tax=Streptomyces cinereoruber TaxID=67260 RepID=UPI0036390D3E